MKRLIHEKCPGRNKSHLVNRRTLICDSCKVRPKAKDIRLIHIPEENPRRKYNASEAQMRMELVLGMPSDSIFKYPRQ